MFSGLLGELESRLQLFPGIGKKSAQRLTMHMINNKNNSLKLAQTIQNAIERIKNCSQCNIISETDPCSFCSDPSRDNSKICVVENTQDVHLINETHEYNGLFFVLGGLISPLDGVGPDDIHLEKLKDRVNSMEIKEVILALNPSSEGESTINYISEILNDKLVKLTRLSTGIPFGGDIGYTSKLTLTDAFKRRYSI